MSYITLSLATIIGITLVSIFISFWVTELADKDAQAINLSGSMRMQTYHIGLALERGETAEARKAIDKLHNTWNHPLFSAQHTYAGEINKKNDALTERFGIAYSHWLNIAKPALLKDISDNGNAKKLNQLLENQVLLTDNLVTQFQKDAERKIVNLRSFQLLVFLITVLVGSLIFYLLKNRIEKPLSQLTDTAKKIAEGKFQQRVDIEGKDELALLAKTFNQMSLSIANSYAELENRVQARTQELQQNNIALEFLFTTAKKILESNRNNLNFQEIIDELANVLNKDKLELCLFTEQGDKPYIQITPSSGTRKNCSNENCHGCRLVSKSQDPQKLLSETRFPIVMEGRHYGIIDLHLDKNQQLPHWQKSLVQSVANQFAIALSLTEQKVQEHRFAMLSERTVIARELHDSLAQALSYLQIQVTRLQKSHDKKAFGVQQPIIDELREGLSSAYRQLRELLATFRLKMDEGGLRAALENTVEQLRQRTPMDIELDYRLIDLPLAANEEIHLLQIVREASQNAVHHSRGSKVIIRLEQLANQSVVLTIDDDGIGISNSPEKLNHYGLAIMSERSRHLGGTVDIHLREQGGTQVHFQFMPSIRHSLSHPTGE